MESLKRTDAEKACTQTGMAAMDALYCVEYADPAIYAGILCRSPRTVKIVLEPGEGGEATRIEVSVAGNSRHARFLSCCQHALCTPTINRCITRALRRFDALLEYQQAQAEQELNVVYLYWQRVQVERACLQRQTITEM